MKKSILIYISIFFLYGCADNWQATVYPNKGDLTNYKHLGKFPSLGECRDASIGYLKDIHALNSGDYECGKNCKYKDEYDMYVCEETSN